MTAIPCEWIKIEKSPWLSEAERRHTKCGRYHQSVFSLVDGFGVKRWVVGGYLKIDFEKYSHLTEDELVEGCVEFLNQKPPRKRKPLYGKLQPVPAPWREGGKYDVKRIGDKLMVCLSTDSRKNKNFWGKGNMVYLKEDGRKTRWKKKK